MPVPPHTSILIIGGGTWGCAIAYRLAKSSFTNIKVLDANEFPSKESAGNDVNKIMEEPESPPEDLDNDEDYAWAVIEALATEVWLNDDIYKPHYHPAGFIYAAVGEDAYEKVEATARGHPLNWTPLRSVDDFKAMMPNGPLTGGMPGWRGFVRKERAGWVEAKKAMEATRRGAQKMGVEFFTGAEGRVKTLLFNKAQTDVVGARTEDGTEYATDQVILSAGAYSDGLLDFKKQLRPTAWTLAHIPLTDEEIERYKDIAVLYGADRGFFIPSWSSKELKVCDEHPGYIHLVKNGGEERSIPFGKQQIPLEAEKRIRDFLNETSPHLATRPFTFARICWDADTPDRLFLIDRHPVYKSLVVAVGGSGHGFMCSPAVGILVRDLIEGRMDERLARILGWREELAMERDWWDTQGRFGVEGKVMDFKDVEGWTDCL